VIKAINTIPIRRRPKPSEEGYMLIAVMLMLALLVIALSVAVPKISKQIQRDREIETMRRGKQYVRAVKMYYKKFGAYPPSIDALVKTNEIRFLRKKYIDPTTGKDEWKIIRFGQNKTQSMGFFGQPLAGSTVAGIGPSGGNGLTGSPGVGTGPGSSTSTGSAFGSTSGASADAGTGSTPSAGGSAGSTDSSSSTVSNSSGGTGFGTGSGTGPGTSPGTGLTGQTFGGGGIIGVSPGSPKQSILVYKKKNHYNEWEFFYDPIVDQMMMQGGNTGAIGQPATSTTTPVGGTSGTSGATGANSGSGGTPTTTPPSPQQ
jgi:type II secretory pathway pseudopilin PulG